MELCTEIIENKVILLDENDQVILYVCPVKPDIVKVSPDEGRKKHKADIHVNVDRGLIESTFHFLNEARGTISSILHKYTT